jgi:hypothetical protein
MELKPQNQQPNSITMSKQQFELIEKRIFYLVINQIEKGINVQKSMFSGNLTVSVPIRMLNDNNYNRIRDAAKALQKRQIWIKDDPKNKEFDVITPFPRIRSNGNVLEVTLFEDTINYFAELGKGYTSYQLMSALSLSSKFSQRIYEMISRFKDTGHWGPISILEFKTLLFIEDKYLEISMFRKRVLETAKKEILEKTELGFNYELIRKGKKYTHIAFTIYKKRSSPDSELRQSINTELDERSSRCSSELRELGIIDRELIAQIIENHQEDFWPWLHKLKTGQLPNLKNPSGHLLTSLGLK